VAGAATQTARRRVNALAHFIFSTNGAVDLLTVAALWLALKPRSAGARRAVIALALFYFVVSIYVVPAFVGSLLARPYHRFDVADVPHGRVALVVFGAGKERVSGWDERIWIPDAVGAARVLETARVYRLAKPQWVISSGGNANPADEAEPDATNMRRQLVELGVPAERIVLESGSRDSHDEAVLIAPMLKSLGADAAILVTSAVHMRRSIGACRAAGWDPTPATAPDPWYDNDWSNTIVPTTKGVYFSGEVMHELLGIPYYRLRGWYR
jgi:uncharacterized SAM-binding protein YcdF (DUF218 family)